VLERGDLGLGFWRDDRRKALLGDHVDIRPVQLRPELCRLLAPVQVVAKVERLDLDLEPGLLPDFADGGLRVRLARLGRSGDALPERSQPRDSM